MFSRQNSAGLLGIDAYMIQIEADISRSMPSFDIVGLPDAAIRESRDRVKSAIKNSGLKFPTGKITINMAPADIRKEGSIYDLPLLVSILHASEQIKFNPEKTLFVGEVSLDGRLRAVNGILAMVLKAREMGIEYFFLPEENAPEGAVVDGINIMPVKTVTELIKYLSDGTGIVPMEYSASEGNDGIFTPDFSEVKGQSNAKAALEIAAAGCHNILLVGAPGSGKSMLAKRLPSILPDMTFEESIETTKIHSVAGVLPRGSGLIKTRPFRSPHHTVSVAGLSGGGSFPKPGEISLAHGGVLFLDEFPEFDRSAMEALRQPLEDGIVNISRASGTLSYPCRITLVAAMNPCPCGYYGHPTKECTCTSSAVRRYLNKISGPMLDRLDLHVEVPPVDFDSLHSTEKEESSAEIRKRVNAARIIQQERYRDFGINCNAELTPALLNKFCVMTDSASHLLKIAFDKLGMSGRAYDRILKVARTIADLDGCETINEAHISRAIHYRSLEDKYWRDND